MVEIWIFVGLGVMVILFLMSGMARLYRKAGPHEALIVYGLGGTRVVQGHGTLVLPMVQICRDLSLELIDRGIDIVQLFGGSGVGGHKAQCGLQLANLERDLRLKAQFAIEGQDLIGIARARCLRVENESHISGMLESQWPLHPAEAEERDRACGLSLATGTASVSAGARGVSSPRMRHAAQRDQPIKPAGREP